MSRRASKRNDINRAQSYHAPVVKAEDTMVYRSDQEYNEYIESADPDTTRRLEALKEKQDHGKDKWLKKLMTRADVFNMMSMWQTQYLIPMAQRVDHLEAYIDFLEKPFYGRWWTRTKAWTIWLVAKIAVKLPFTFRSTKNDTDGAGLDDRGDGAESDQGTSPAQ